MFVLATIALQRKEEKMKWLLHQLACVVAVSPAAAAHAQSQAPAQVKAAGIKAATGG